MMKERRTKSKVKIKKERGSFVNTAKRKKHFLQKKIDIG